MTVTAAPAIADLSRFIPDLRSRRKESVLGELADAAARAGAVRVPRALVGILKIRERVAPALVIRDAIVLAARSLAVTRPFVVVGRSTAGIEWPGADEPVRLVVAGLVPAETGDERFHAHLARAVGLVRLQKQRQRLLASGSDGMLASMLREPPS